MIVSPASDSFGSTVRVVGVTENADPVVVALTASAPVPVLPRLSVVDVEAPQWTWLKSMGAVDRTTADAPASPPASPAASSLPSCPLASSNPASEDGWSFVASARASTPASAIAGAGTVVSSPEPQPMSGAPVTAASHDKHPMAKLARRPLRGCPVMVRGPFPEPRDRSVRPHGHPHMRLRA